MALWQFALWTTLGAYVTYASLVAISASWNNENFPEALALKLEFLPIIFPLHMLAGGAALIFVPLTIFFRQTHWHKLLGRLTTIVILIAGITAFPVAIEAPITKISAAGFSVQATLWIAFLVSGIWHIRNGRSAQHRACMWAVAALTSGAMFFRIGLALWKIFGTAEYFKLFYAVDAWIAWLIPLAVVYLCTVKIKAGTVGYY